MSLGCDENSHLISVSFSYSDVCHSIAAAIPRSSSTPGLSSAEILFTVWIVLSTSLCIVFAFSNSNSCPSGNLLVNHDKSIFRAVNTCPISSWISRAILFLSSSLTDSRCAERLRSCSPEVLKPSSACLRSVISVIMWKKILLPSRVNALVG